MGPDGSRQVPTGPDLRAIWESYGESSGPRRWGATELSGPGGSEGNPKTSQDCKALEAEPQITAERNQPKNKK